MITSVTAPEPHEPEQEPKTEAEVIAAYKVDRKQALENVANVASAAVTKGVLKEKMAEVATVISAAADKPVLDFDEDFKDFRPDTSLLSAAYHNRVNLIRLGIDPDTDDDTVFGSKNIYCGAHVRVHGTGWCTVRLCQKRPLKSEDRNEAIAEAKALGLFKDA